MRVFDLIDLLTRRSWLYEMNLYDLKTNQWISKTMQPEANGLHSKGAYRSVCVSSKQRVITPEPDGDTQVGAKHSYSIDEDGEGGGESGLRRRSF